MPAPFALPALPWPESALEPIISTRTIEFHYGKHHKTYVDILNKLIEGTDLADLALIEIVRRTAKDADRTKVFNNAGQSWNHTFFWESMKPQGGGKPHGKIAELIDADLGGYEKFIEEFLEAGTTQFGSGWAWLVIDKGKLAITKTPNGESPIYTTAVPLLTVDVWEHAYYLDYQNRRKDYISGVIENLTDWDRVNARLAAA
ncbi:MAG: superoxide dismutase [Alphaproteobacteria bacterium]|nr:superoxide dismutase [Alphaproteobacteria bacterium]